MNITGQMHIRELYQYGETDTYVDRGSYLTYMLI